MLPRSTPVSKRNSRVNSRKLALLGAVAGLGLAACSPGGAANKQAAAPAPMNMAAQPVNAAQPSVGAPVASPGAAATVGATEKVTITNFAFSPAILTIRVGTKVVWTNNDIVAHTVTFIDVPNSPVLKRDDTFSRYFTAAGTYSYICSIHPFMHGTVVVTL
jgi:plastocyanin